MFIYYLITILALTLTCATIILVKKFKSEKLSLTLKLCAVTLAITMFFRYFLGDDYLQEVLNLEVVEGFSSRTQVALSFILYWIFASAVLLVIIYPFFNVVKTARLLSATFAPFVLLISVIFLKNNMLASVGVNDIENYSLRAILLAIETGFAFALSLYAVYDYIINRKKSDYKISSKVILCAVFSALGMIVATMPHYAPQLLLNPYDYVMKVDDLNLYHRLFLYPIAIIPISLYLILKDKSFETKRFALIYYAVAHLYLYSFNHRFADFTSVSGLPFHLCNTALYITPICLIFNSKKVFYFTYFINVLGAFFAMAMPSYSTEGVLEGTLITVNTIKFFRPHWQAFFMPLLTVGLGIFPRPRLKEFKYSLVAFGVYYFLMLVLNGWFTNYDPEIDYFFINSDFIAGKLGTWAENLRDLTWSFKIGELSFTYYPIYQVLYFLVYVVLSLGMWFIYELAYEAICGWKDIAIRNKKVKVDELALQVALNGRKKEEPMDLNSTNKLILKNFTKRYGTSDVYAVKDANLEINGGEVFGFLGPNGAGKSTIIKSIVGIQTITDGEIKVCGYDVDKQPVQAKAQIGFVPDHYALYEKLTAREYVNYIADLYGVSIQDRNDRLSNLIKLFEFEHAIDNPIKTYSHGMKQKVTIMSALIHEPKVWILDEPLTGLDPNSIFQVKECMKNHAKKGNIVFFSSHIIDVVEKICDKIAIIKKGQIQCVKTVKDIEKTSSLEEFYMHTINDSQVEAISVVEKTIAQND